MKSSLLCPRMKYKSRVAVSGIGLAILLIAGVLLLDISSDNVQYTDGKLHSPQTEKQHLAKDQIVIRDVTNKPRDVPDKPRDVPDKPRDVPDKPRDEDDKPRDVDESPIKLNPDNKRREEKIERLDISIDMLKNADEKTNAVIDVNDVHIEAPNVLQEKSKFHHKTVMYNEDIEKLLDRLEVRSGFGFDRDFIQITPFKDIALQLGKKNREKSKHLLRWDTHELRDDRTSNFIRFHHGIRAAAMYDPEDPAVDGLLHDMATDTIKSVDMIARGTELKLLVWFRKGTKAVFKPMRWGREVETLPNHFYFNDFERHNAEIAAFHLDRILGFYRVPPVTGRRLNMTKEIYDLGERALQKTFYISPVGNTCFFGECDYYCDSNHAFCGKRDMIEGSLMVWLPDGRDAERDSWKSPYRRSYSKFRKAEWETDNEFCQKMMKHSPHLYKRYIPDLIDSHIFDFITGNMDRHHVEVFGKLKNDSCPIHLDNGRGFGKAKVDEVSIIVPLKQCCRIRKSTFLKLAKLYIGPERLGDLLDSSLKSDPIYPVILPEYYEAVDRRVVHILSIVAECSHKYGVDKVIIADGF